MAKCSRHVDDLTTMSRNMNLINRLKAELSKRFKMKDQGDIHYILKMEVHRNRDQRVMMISQRKYIAELITKYKLGESVSNDTASAWPRSVSLSTAEAELIALSEGAKESEWLWYLLGEMGFSRSKPVQVWSDSNAPISIVKNPGNFKANKHIDICYLFTWDLVELGRLKVAYGSTTEMAADILTKVLPTKQLLKLREKLGVRDLELSPVLSGRVGQGALLRAPAES
ncbi:unnamed protein product [Phytophthora fragariaefolia]|uniref:Unnamed protein product n=1 Tax=Phytophthora fragariaefolia TaxID=1490495 RepID=A0A9W6U0G9_9STRA|nr:unnamed protein product [Phytophthora fragariaefolia]